MICKTCREAGSLTDLAGSHMALAELKELHADCKGDTHCDCQHKPTELMPNGSRAQRRN